MAHLPKMLSTVANQSSVLSGIMCLVWHSYQFLGQAVELWAKKHAQAYDCKDLLVLMRCLPTDICMGCIRHAIIALYLYIRLVEGKIFK